MSAGHHMQSKTVIPGARPLATGTQTLELKDTFLTPSFFYILVVNNLYHVFHYNPKFQKKFKCSEKCVVSVFHF